MAPEDQTLTKASSLTASKERHTKTTDRLNEKKLFGGLIETIQEPSSESLLWRAVIGQAIRDIYTAGRGAEKNRREVAEWLTSEDYETVCALAEIDADNMKEQIVNLLSMPRSLAKKYGVRLREFLTEKDIFLNESIDSRSEGD